MKTALRVKPFPYGTAIGEALKKGMWPVSYPFGIAKAGIEKQVGQDIGMIFATKGGWYPRTIEQLKPRGKVGGVPKTEEEKPIETD
jgi:hypothetical protein